jgi:hypothetical protein
LVPGEVTREELEAILRYDGFAGWWDAITALFINIGGSLLVGTAIVAPICGLLTYPIMLWIVKKFKGTPREPIS